MSEAAIVCREVVKQFQKEARPAVDGVSLDVRAGELIVLLGPSGCGKTTLLKMINRLYEPTSGEIWVGGQEVRQVPLTELRRRIGYVIQQVGLFPHMRIEENIAVVPQLLGWDRSRTNQRIDALLEMVDLPLAYRQRYPRQLSGGEQQRVGLARALAADPGILLMDEPFAAIDAITRTALQGELLDIQRKLHKTILFVTHDVEEALRLADRIAVLRQGRLVQYAPPLEILVSPADPFVDELVGGGDVFRRLSLLQAGDLLAARPRLDQAAAARSPAAEVPVVQANQDLRSVLAHLMSSQSERVMVVDADGQTLDQIGFEDLRQVLFAPSQLSR